MTSETIDSCEKNDAPSATPLNALVHGVYAKDVVLPGENEADFEKLHAALKLELDPQGCMEEETVFEIARLSPNRRRIVRLMQKIEPSKASSDGSSTQGDDPNAYRKSMVTVGQSLQKRVEEAKANVDKVLSGPMPLDEESKKSLDKARGDFDFVLNILRNYFGYKPQSLVDTPPIQPAEPLKESPIIDILGKVFRLETSIDARIDKNLGRLANLKEYKRIEASKCIAPKTAPKLERAGEIVTDGE